MKKTIIFILLILIVGIASAATTPTMEDYQKTKDTLVDMTMRWNDAVKLNQEMSVSLNALITDLKSIKEPGDELKSVLEKYNIK